MKRSKTKKKTGVGVNTITSFFSKLTTTRRKETGRESSGSSSDEPEPKRPCSAEPASSSCSTSEAQCDSVTAAEPALLLPPPASSASSSTDTGGEPGGGAATATSAAPGLGDAGAGGPLPDAAAVETETDVVGDHGAAAVVVLAAGQRAQDRRNSAQDSAAAVRMHGFINAPSSSSASASAPTSLPRTRHVPSVGYIFPKTDGRSCRFEWFGKYGWLHYIPDHDHVLCFTCMKAQELGNTCASRGHGIDDSADPFLKKGFNKWKKATERFSRHENSKYHREAAEYLVLALKRESVGSLLDAQLKKSQQDARAAYKVVISSIRYLARSGQALRGGEHYSGNLVELLEERAEECPQLSDWLKKRDNWISSDIQNEVLEIIAHTVMRTLLKDIEASSFYSLMADGTTDISDDEQLSVCFRYVDRASLESYEVFLGLVSVTSGKADFTKRTLDDVLLRLGIDKSKQRGHTFDGCAAMAGHLNGVQKLICDELPKSLFVHCSNHSLDLVVQELARECDLFGDTLVLIKEVSKAILESAKRKAIYANIVLEPCFSDDETTAGGPSAIRQLLSMCPTRWCVRSPAIRRFDENYDRVRATLRLLVEDKSLRLSDERRATLRGHLQKLDQFSTVLAIKLSLLICEPAEQLARALQSTGYTATGAKQAAQGMWDTYNAMGEDEFDRVWRETEVRNESRGMDLEMPVAPRQRAPPRRLGEVGNRAPTESLPPRTVLRQKFIAVLDRAKNQIQLRFNQPGMEKLVKLENVLLQREPLDSVEDLKNEMGVHADDFDCDMLFTQLKIAKLVVPEHVKNVKEYAVVLRNLPEVSREMINQVELLVVLLLVVPATSATCERSFSALRRIKTYLRSTMSQKRLTHLMMCHVHKARTHSVSVSDVFDEFVSRSAERLKVFGPPFKPQ